MSAGSSRCAPCSNPPTRKSPAANSRPSAPAVRAASRHPAPRLGTKNQPQGARRIRGRRDHRRRLRLPHQVAPGGWQSRPRRRATNIIRSTFDPTEDLSGLRDGLRDRSERRAALERARDNDRVTAIRNRLYRDEGGRPAPTCSSPFPSTPRERRATRSWTDAAISPASSSASSISAAAPVDSNDHWGKPAVSVNVYPPVPGRSSAWRMLPDYSSAATAPQSMRALARALHWSGNLRIGDTDWQVRAVPTAGDPLETTYDRAGAVLIVGMLLTLSFRPISCSQAAIRSGCRWRTGGCSNSPRPTS